MRLSLLAFAILCLVRVPTAQAVELTLTGDRYWVVLASRQDVDEAIAVARNQHDDKAIVVRAANGRYAAVIGPRALRPNSGRAVLGELIKDHGVPKDAYLSRGKDYTEVAWTAPATNVGDTLAYDGEHDATLRKDDLAITLSRRPDGDSTYDATATATYKGKPAFTMAMGTDNPAEKPASQVELVRLDPASALPQVVFTYFWQGAHCCTVTKIATLAKDGAWHIVDGETLDGGGYGFEDLDGKGFSDLISSDQDFLYAFASYAESVAPLQIHQLVGDKLVDVTHEARFRHRLLQALDLDVLWSSENADGDSWHSNGFLAGWVAGSMLVDRGEAAWRKMLVSYDHGSDVLPDWCTVNLPIDKCPETKKERIAYFPAALKRFLTEYGYIRDPAKYPVPPE